MAITERKQEDFEAALRNQFSAIHSLPSFQGDGYASATSGTLIDDTSTTSGYGVRRCEIYNTDAVQTVGIKILLAGETATGHTIDDCKKIAPGATWSVVVGTNMRLAAVASGGGATVNLLIHDFV